MFTSTTDIRESKKSITYEALFNVPLNDPPIKFSEISSFDEKSHCLCKKEVLLALQLKIDEKFLESLKSKIN